MGEWQDLTKRQPRYEADRTFYDKVRAAQPQYKLVDKFSIAPYNGRGFMVKKGQTFRVIEEAGPQVGAVAFWNADDSKETFLAASTWGHEGVFVKVYSRMLSGLPWFRPMLTCVEDTVVTESPHADYHHHFMGSHCSPELIEMWFAHRHANACRLNLLEAIEPFGLEEKDLHDNINVHQKVHLGDMKAGRICTERSDSKRGDYIEFYAELNMLVAVSVCPFGDGTGDPTRPEETKVQPLGIEIYETGIAPQGFPKWTDWRPAWDGEWTLPRV
jgi:uncharacterized protein YcgI (DUF1989 family)